jgi:hypothetical protein
MRTFPPKLVLCASSLALSFATAALTIPIAHAQDVACPAPVVVQEAPPPLPAYDQPPIPGPGYLWTPGYWHWSEDEEDYYWVPGAWVEPPRPGLLWTPGYWGWAGGSYLFHPGYWGQHVGFYGGIDYGHGYSGEGFHGGRWRNGTFFYNRSVTNITNARVTNIYEEKVSAPRTASNVSFNGGREGVQARPTTEQRAFARDPHFAATTQQRGHVETSGKDKALFSKTNHGNPAASAAPGLAPRSAPANAGEPGARRNPADPLAPSLSPHAAPGNGAAPTATGNHQGEKPLPRGVPAEGGAPTPTQGTQDHHVPGAHHEKPASIAPQGGKAPAAAHQDSPAVVPSHSHADRPTAAPTHSHADSPAAVPTHPRADRPAAVPPQQHGERPPAMHEERAVPRQDTPRGVQAPAQHPPAMHAEPHAAPSAPAMHAEPHAPAAHAPAAMHGEPHAPAAHPHGGSEREEHKDK